MAASPQLLLPARTEPVGDPAAGAAGVTRPGPAHGLLPAPHEPLTRADPLDREGLSDPDSGRGGAASGDGTELPLTSEPPLAAANPLTSEPPLAAELPLTSEPTVVGTGPGTEPTEI